MWGDWQQIEQNIISTDWWWLLKQLSTSCVYISCMLSLQDCLIRFLVWWKVVNAHLTSKVSLNKEQRVWGRCHTVKNIPLCQKSCYYSYVIISAFILLLTLNAHMHKQEQVGAAGLAAALQWRGWLQTDNRFWAVKDKIWQTAWWRARVEAEQVGV